jgi:hypothetical protein
MEEEIERDWHNFPTLFYIKWVAQSIDVRRRTSAAKVSLHKENRAGS